MFGRLVTAMVTPFDEAMRLDMSRLSALIEHLISTGTTTLLVCGTTGESPTLCHEEKIALIEATLQMVAGRIPVIAGTGTNATQDTVHLTQEVDRLGVNGLLVVAPYYNKPSQEGIYQHFLRVASQTDQPILIYNIPGRTSVNIQTETMIRLAQIPNIIGVKESSGDFTQIARVRNETPNHFLVYSGDDKYTLPIMALGGDGVVSVCSHLVGEEMTQLVDAMENGDLIEARRVNARLFPLYEEIFRTSNPVLVKAGLNMLGIPVGGVRLPLVDATFEEKRSLRRVLGETTNLAQLH